MSLLHFIFGVLLSSLYVHADYGCGYVTVWLEKTVYQPIPVYSGGKASREHYKQVYQTVTKINTQSVPYFVTQTQNVPQFVTQKATLPQYVTHTVVHTHPKYETVTEKTFVTVTATRTRKTYETVCPKKFHKNHHKGHGHQKGHHKGYH